MALFRADQVLLAGDEDKASTGFLCNAERFVRGVARTGAPVYGARSRLGRLMLGKERFCGVDASPTTISSRSLATVWRKGGGILGFTEDGDLEMVTPSGDVIWAIVEGHAFDELAVKRAMNHKVQKMLSKKHQEEKKQRLNRIEKDLEETVKRRKKEEEKHGERKKGKDGAGSKKKTRRRWNVFPWNNRAAREAATDTSSTETQAMPHRPNAFVRVSNRAASEAATGTTSTTTEGRPHEANAFVRVVDGGQP